MSFTITPEPMAAPMSMADGNTTDLNCSNCDVALRSDEFMRCSTCVCASETVKVFCDTCICAHTRRGHKILDHSGYEISVCDDHKIINDLFCIPCSQVLCSKCLHNHR